ncbi:MAG TPA: hypothetical protein VG755_05630 [Nannocystaceae bacterium]|nr:hypothetical protein [Nannocystaceae bacterium]
MTALGCGASSSAGHGDGGSSSSGGASTGAIAPTTTTSTTDSASSGVVDESSGAEASEESASETAAQPDVVADCRSIAEPSGPTPMLAPGLWTDISPPGLHRPYGEAPPFGCMDIHVLPCAPSTLYLTTDIEGMWKSTDGGATWATIGDLPEPVSPGVMEIDPADPLHMYYVGGVRGASPGFWISNDGGDTWTMPAGFAEHADNSVGGWTNDTYHVAVDPADFDHVLLGFHSGFEFTGDAGVLESTDGGQSWTRHDPMPGWGAGHSVWFVGDAQSWLLGTQGDGYWRTADGGASWTQVIELDMQHGGVDAYYAKNGALYVGALGQILRSEDDGMTFELVGPSTSDGYYSIVGDGTRLYAQLGNTGGNTTGPQPFVVSDEDDGFEWTEQNDQTFSDGPYRMEYDAVNGIMYAASWNEGVLALRPD